MFISWNVAQFRLFVVNQSKIPHFTELSRFKPNSGAWSVIMSYVSAEPGGLCTKYVNDFVR